MKVCIVSDSHDNHDYLVNAVTEAKEKGAEAVLHCGDVVASKTIIKLEPIGLPVHVIHGNNMGDTHNMMRAAHRRAHFLHYYGQDAGIRLADRRIFLVHYPHYAEAMCTTGKWDLVCCGHDHKANIEAIRNVAGSDTWLVNPGTVGGIDAPATYVMGDLENMHFEIMQVPVPQMALLD